MELKTYSFVVNFIYKEHAIEVRADQNKLFCLVGEHKFQIPNRLSGVIPYSSLQSELENLIDEYYTELHRQIDTFPIAKEN